MLTQGCRAAKENYVSNLKKKSAGMLRRIVLCMNYKYQIVCSASMVLSSSSGFANGLNAFSCQCTYMSLLKLCLDL
jgi:hypothetical protein